MAVRPLPPRDLVRQLLDYDPETGVLTWRKNGKVAGSIRRDSGYVNIDIGGVKYKAHRIIWWLLYPGPVPDLIDHRDLNPTNNRPDNLRAATHSQNKTNRRTDNRNVTGWKGVSIHSSGKFRAQIKHLGKASHIGLYDTVEEAQAAYYAEAIRLQGEFARPQ